MPKNITPALLKTWHPCADGYQRFCELFPKGADLKTATEGLITDGHDGWAFWLFEHARAAGGFEAETAKGYRNSGYLNSGYRNSGDLNSGYRNSGDRNSGDLNSGDLNSGDLNSGYRNSGYRNSGYRNSGDRNSGDLNSGDYNTGFFNTVTPEDILVFNKPCTREQWNNAPKPGFIYDLRLTEWVEEGDMTDAEKVAHPLFYVAQGYLKTNSYKDAFQAAWKRANAADKKKLLALPNFDAAVFEEISGIKVKG